MGITRDGRVLVDRVTLHGTLTTSNPAQPSIWVNNINQPRRTGAKLIVYTRRWADVVEMKYAGTLLAVDALGRIVGKATTRLSIPYGGFVLSDSKVSAIADLAVGDEVRLSWQVGPSGWNEVVNAVSGGPVLIRDGKLFVNCQDERFCKAWTGNQIKARTAVGVTADRHLLLATIEGRHTLWDVAKFLKKLGCVDAMNLDGGGSTTMVVNGKTVTHNSSNFQRKVASAVAIVPRSQVDGAEYRGVAQVRQDLNPRPFAVATQEPVASPLAVPEKTSAAPLHFKRFTEELPPRMVGVPRLPICPLIEEVRHPITDSQLGLGRSSKHYSILPTPQWGEEPPRLETRRAGRYFGLFKRSQQPRSDDRS